MQYTIDSILSNPAFISTVINRVMVTLTDADRIDWKDYLVPATTNPDGTFKTYSGNMTAVVVGSFIDKNSGKPVRKRQSMMRGYGEVGALGESYQMTNDQLTRLQELVNTLNQLQDEASMEDVIAFLVDDFRQCTLAAHKRMDLMLNDLKFTGKAEARSKTDQDGVKLQTITLPSRKDKNLFMPDASYKATFLSYIESIIPILRQNGCDATIMEMNRYTFRNYIVGCEEFSKSFIAKYGNAQFNPGALASPDMFNQLFEHLEIPLRIRLKDVYVTLQDKTAINIVPNAQIALIPDEKIGFLRHRKPYELDDKISSKTYSEQDDDLFVATERTKEGRFTEYGAEWIVDVNKSSRMGRIDLSAFEVKSRKA